MFLFGSLKYLSKAYNFYFYFLGKYGFKKKGVNRLLLIEMQIHIIYLFF